MLFKSQIAFQNKDDTRRKCTMVFESHDHDTAPTAIRNIAGAYFGANVETIDIIQLDALSGGFAVLGRWPS